MAIRANCICLAAATFALTGCEQVMHSIYREPTADRNISVVTDAKQRVILSVQKTDQNTKQAIRITCAEPSPDVAQAISQAFTLAVNAERFAPLPTGSSGENRSGTGVSLGSASAASVAQLGERLATIQLLRDKMYRACEAYANGAVGATGYTLMLARLDKTMATLLSNEMAAGAFGRALAHIGGSASTNGAISPLAVEKARNDAQAAADKLILAKDGDDEKKAAEELNSAMTTLLALDRANSISVAGSSAGGTTALGTIPSLTNIRFSGQIADIHRNFIDDDGIEPLIDACINAMEHGDSSRESAIKEAAKAFADSAAKDRVTKLEAAFNRIRIARTGIRIEGNNSQKLQQELNELDRQRRGMTASQAASAKIADKEVELKGKLKTALENLEHYERELPDAQESLRAAQKDVDASYDDKVTDAYLQAGLTFPAFCHRAVFADNAPFIKARADAKFKLRSLDVKREEAATSNPVCGSLMVDADFRKYLREADDKNVPVAARKALKDYCDIELPKPKEPEKKP